MGYYDTTKLPIYVYLHGRGAPNYVIADRFFQGAFGGSFLNHQWLIAAATPLFAGALNDGSANDLHSVVDPNGMPTSTPLYTSPLGAARQGRLADGIVQPAGGTARDAGRRRVRRLCRQHDPAVLLAVFARHRRRTAPAAAHHADDRRPALGRQVDWAWYSGGWSNANGDVGAPGWTNGTGPTCTDPERASPARATRTARTSCSSTTISRSTTSPTTRRAPRPAPPTCATRRSSSHAAQNGTLKPVSFIKPVGEENEHPGYTSETEGSRPPGRPDQGRGEWSARHATR